MRVSLEQDLLRTFVTIVDAGSSANAARRLHRTPSGISMQMRRLEEVVGKPIFQKSGRLISLTATGEALVPYARQIIHLLDHALDQVLGGQVSEEIILGVAEDYVASLLPVILRVLHKYLPASAISLRTGSSSQLYEMTRSDQVELAVITRRAAWEDVEYIRSERLVWTSVSETIAKSTEPIPIAMFRQGCVRRELIMDALTHRTESFRIACTSETHAGLVAVARTGVAIAPMAHCCVPEDLYILGDIDGLPELPLIELGLARSSKATASSSLLASCIMDVLTDRVTLPGHSIAGFASVANDAS